MQSIRAHRVEDLQAAAQQLGHRFVCQPGQGTEQTRCAGPDRSPVHISCHFGKNFDALYDCLTDTVHKAGPQTGFIVVLEHICARQV